MNSSLYSYDMFAIYACIAVDSSGSISALLRKSLSLMKLLFNYRTISAYWANAADSLYSSPIYILFLILNLRELIGFAESADSSLSSSSSPSCIWAISSFIFLKYSYSYAVSPRAAPSSSPASSIALCLKMAFLY